MLGVHPLALALAMRHPAQVRAAIEAGAERAGDDAHRGAEPGDAQVRPGRRITADDLMISQAVISTIATAPIPSRRGVERYVDIAQIEL